VIDTCQQILDLSSARIRACLPRWLSYITVAATHYGLLLHEYFRAPPSINMLTRTIYASTLLSALALAAPAPQVPGYTDADFPISESEPTGEPASSFGTATPVPVRISACVSLCRAYLSIGHPNHSCRSRTTTEKFGCYWRNQPWALLRHSHYHRSSHGEHHSCANDCASAAKSDCDLLQCRWYTSQSCPGTLHAQWYVVICNVGQTAN
jgi:hypothetical protein